MTACTHISARHKPNATHSLAVSWHQGYTCAHALPKCMGLSPRTITVPKGPEIWHLREACLPPWQLFSDSSPLKRISLFHLSFHCSVTPKSWKELKHAGRADGLTVTCCTNHPLGKQPPGEKQLNSLSKSRKNHANHSYMITFFPISLLHSALQMGALPRAPRICVFLCLISQHSFSLCSALRHQTSEDNSSSHQFHMY